MCLLRNSHSYIVQSHTVFSRLKGKKHFFLNSIRKTQLPKTSTPKMKNLTPKTSKTQIQNLPPPKIENKTKNRTLPKPNPSNPKKNSQNANPQKAKNPIPQPKPPPKIVSVPKSLIWRYSCVLFCC